MRADQLLVERGFAASRSQAARLIASGLRWCDGGAWQRVRKSGQDLPVDSPLELVDAREARYVSRGGLKLEGALAHTGAVVSGSTCLDVGQSTGGFTDCLLRHGALRVVGIDVGHGQLHPRLRDDPRVTAFEGINARSLDALAWPGQTPAVSTFDLVVADLSFISLTLVLGALRPWVADAGCLLLLVKPQFELQPGQLGKGGIVRSPALFDVVENRIRDACAGHRLAVLDWFESPICGGDGNREFFLHAAPAASANRE